MKTLVIAACAILALVFCFSLIPKGAAPETPKTTATPAPSGREPIPEPKVVVKVSKTTPEKSERTMSRRVRTAESPKKPDLPKGPLPGQVGYVGILTGGPSIPVCVNADDVSSITRKDRDAMRDLLIADALFAADGGASVKIVRKKFPGLVKIEVLGGESTGREGWVPYEMVQ